MKSVNLRQPLRFDMARIKNVRYHSDLKYEHSRVCLPLHLCGLWLHRIIRRWPCLLFLSYDIMILGKYPNCILSHVLIWGFMIIPQRNTASENALFWIQERHLIGDVPTPVSQAYNQQLALWLNICGDKNVKSFCI